MHSPTEKLPVDPAPRFEYFLKSLTLFDGSFLAGEPDQITRPPLFCAPYRPSVLAGTPGPAPAPAPK